jgi:2-dehydro-3-deoxyphosphogluconate aldolase/(4S)-4-hydroxy-2-oxoglutarate aldolase
MEVFERVQALGVLPVVELPTGADPLTIVDALVSGGLGCIEITLRTPGAVEAIREVCRARPDVLVVAGTILGVEHAEAAVDAGAALLVSPGLSPRLIDWAQARGVPVLPGVCTPTEIEQGRERGLEVFKFFPAEAAGGRRYLTAIAAPYPMVRFVPSGGIDVSNLARYLELPNVLACGGSWMVSAQLLADGDLPTVARLAAEAAAIVMECRAGQRPRFER